MLPTGSYSSNIIDMPITSTTPCVGICSSGIGDDVCRGCKRFAHEVIDWNNYNAADQQLVLARLDEFLVKIIKLKVQLIDYDKYLISINKLEVGFDRPPDPYLQWYNQLVADGRQFKSEKWGFKVRASYRHLGMEALWQDIEAEFFELSKAHYDRYIAPGIVGSNYGK